MDIVLAVLVVAAIYTVKDGRAGKPGMVVLFLAGLAVGTTSLGATLLNMLPPVFAGAMVVFG